MHGPLLFAAASLPQVATMTPEEAIARQQQEVREAIATSPCRPGASDEEIVVCGRLHAPPPTRPVFGYAPPRGFAAPQDGPWFEFTRGRLSVSCCAISTARGSAAGLGLRIGF
jgi:hypothetical protein